MDPIKLLAQQIHKYQEQNQKQFHQYQEQNERDHEKLENKIDQILDMMQALTMEINSQKKRNEGLEEGQNDIKETVNDIDERVKNLEQSQLESKHLRDWIIRGLGIATVIVGLITAIWKLGIF